MNSIHQGNPGVRDPAPLKMLLEHLGRIGIRQIIQQHQKIGTDTKTFRIGRQTLPVTALGLVEVAPSQIDIPQITQGARQTRIDLQCPIESRNGILDTPHVLINRTQITERFGLARPGRNNFTQHPYRCRPVTQ